MKRMLAISSKAWTPKRVRRLRAALRHDDVWLHLVSSADDSPAQVDADRYDTLLAPPPATGLKRLLTRPRPTSPADRLREACAAGGPLADWAAGVDAVLVPREADCRLLAPLLAIAPVPVVHPTARRDLVRAGVLDERRPAPEDEPLPVVPDADTRLLIGPANFAGQGHAWARAVERLDPRTVARNVRFGTLDNPFPSDLTLGFPTLHSNPAWRAAWREWVTGSFTHVLLEANRAILPTRSVTGFQQVDELRRAGLQVAMLSHGSDVRVPSIHAERERWHSYGAFAPEPLAVMEHNARRNLEQYLAFDGPVFVSTPGLRAFLPDGIWAPVVVDVAMWRTEQPLCTGRLPVVAHAPSNVQKGSHLIDPVLQRLHDEGVVEYRRIQGVPFAEMPGIYQAADLVVEQFGAADYGTAACEAMAAGRVVVSRVHEDVRRHVRERTGLELPIVEADPDTLEQVIRRLVADPERCRQVGAQGAEFAERVHDGRYSAAVIAAWMHGPGAPSETINPLETRGEDDQGE